MMMALGIFFSGCFVSAASDVQLSNPTKIRMAKVDCTRTPLKEWNLIMSNPPLKAHVATCCGLWTRYQIARALKITSVTHWMILIQMLVSVEPVTPRYAI